MRKFVSNNFTMSIKLKYYVRTLLIFGLLYAILGSIFDYFIFNETVSVNEFIIKGFLFGISISVFLVSLHLYELNQMGITYITTEILKPTQSKFIPSKRSLSEVTHLLKNSDYNLTGKIIPDSNDIEIVQKINFQTFGEKITIIPTIKNDIKGYNIKSKPVFPLTYGDMGRGVKHILKLEKLLEKGLL